VSVIADKLIELKMGLQRNDPTFCGAAPSWLVETIQRNLDAIIAQAPDDCQRIKDFAVGAIRYVADQTSDADSDVLLNRLNELIIAAG
jgi:hypothetical protein